MELQEWFGEDYEDVIRITARIPGLRLEWYDDSPIWFYDLGDDMINITDHMPLFERLQTNANGMGYKIELIIATLDDYISQDVDERWYEMIGFGDEHWRYNRYLFARFEKK